MIFRWFLNAGGHGRQVVTPGTGVDYSPIAAGFKGLLPSTAKPRPACSDDDGLIIENCLTRLKKKKPDEYSLLVAHYLLRISKRQIARTRKKSEKAIRIEMQIAEGFIDGCLSMLGVRLEMDDWLPKKVKND